MVKVSEAERAQALEYLRDGSIRPGVTVHTILRHVAASGMSRAIDLIVIPGTQDRDGAYHTLRPTWNAAKVLGWTYNRKWEAITVEGAGMDMGFHLVYELSRCLYPNGFGCIGETCPSNDHSNGDRDYRPMYQSAFGPEAPHWHRDGGYALRQRWL